jgi:hypothetical protein
MQEPTRHITEADVQVRGSVISLMDRLVGVQSGRQILGLLVLVTVPLGLVSAAALVEGRFLLGSVRQELAGHGTMVGMSFLGDTMVWPFSLVVPLCLVLLADATRRTVRLMNKIIAKVSDLWLHDESNIGYRATLDRTLRIFTLEYGWQGRVLRVLPWIVLILFWGYNTATCAFHDVLPDGFYPYKEAEVRLVTSDSDDPRSALGQSPYLTKIVLESPVDVPKWDCDRIHAPLSCWSTRLWTAVFYGLTPFILVRLITILWAVISFLRRTAAWNDAHPEHAERGALRIEPFAEDDFGGLGYLADAGMMYFYSVIAFISLVAMAFLKEGLDPSWHNYLVIVVLLPVALVALFMPSWTIHKAIREMKERYLGKLGTHINELSRMLLDEAPPKTDGGGLTRMEINASLGALMTLRKETTALSVWPFSTSTMLRVAAAAFIPLAMMLLETLLQTAIFGT